MLKVGQKAFNFSLPDQTGRTVSLSDFKGQKVVLYFYPKDETPGCTKQACAFRNAYAGFLETKIPLIGISRDSAASHKQFAEKYELPFPLLADAGSTVIAAYDVKGAFGAIRTTYIIGEDGLIEKVFQKVSPETSATDVLKYLRK